MVKKAMCSQTKHNCFGTVLVSIIPYCDWTVTTESLKGRLSKAFQSLFTVCCTVCCTVYCNVKAVALTGSEILLSSATILFEHALFNFCT